MIKKVLALFGACSLLLTGCDFNFLGNRFENEGTDTEQPSNPTEEEGGGEAHELPVVEEGGELSFILQDDDTYAVSIGTAINKRNIEVPSDYNGKNVTAIAEFGYDNESFDKTLVREINFPSTIKRIYDNAFYYNKGNTALIFNTQYQDFKTLEFGINCFGDSKDYSNFTFYFMDQQRTGNGIFNNIIVRNISEHYEKNIAETLHIGLGIDDDCYHLLNNEDLTIIISDPTIATLTYVDNDSYLLETLKDGTTLIELKYTTTRMPISKILSINVGEVNPIDPPVEEDYNFSVGLASESSVIDIDSSNEYLKVYSFDNQVGRHYHYTSTDKEVATIDSNGKITPVSPGYVNFEVTEINSGKTATLKRDIVVVSHYDNANGGYNYSATNSNSDLSNRSEIIGKLEKYAMNNHLAGIPLFEDGGMIKFSNRVQIPTQAEQYIPGYGFGILEEGELNGTLSSNDWGSSDNPTYYHDYLTMDYQKISQFNAITEDVFNLASHITSPYWGTKLSDTKDDYVWYPVLATDEVKVPTFTADGSVASYASTKTKNNQPIPAEAPNATNLYKKWRIYVKTDGDVNGANLKYTTASCSRLNSVFNGRGVTIDDYEYIYQLLFTGSNNTLHGRQMANDVTYGIKGAKRFFVETLSETDPAKIQAKWDEFKESNKLGIKTGVDINGAYIDLELINPIDSFTAMHQLSNNILSPLPKDLFVGSNALTATDGGTTLNTLSDRVRAYGTFNRANNEQAILDYTLCLGPYTLSKWQRFYYIIFDRNDNWFETPSQGGNRYKIPGVYYRVFDISTDPRKIWKYFDDRGAIDVAPVPTSEVEANKGRENVHQLRGDETLKFNVNSCTQDEWDNLFGSSGSVYQNSESWNVKPWMSNDNFLDGLFYSINRSEFASKRGFVPSQNYFSNEYKMINEVGGNPYNDTQAHKDAMRGYSENYGYNIDKAIDCFRIAVRQLCDKGQLVLGPSKENPTEIQINIRWMYQTDIREYGEDIKSYFEAAFNNDAVCGGRVKLKVVQDAVVNYEDMYNYYLLQGKFDLAVGYQQGDKYNPLKSMESLKSDTSSLLTFNWGADTSKVDDKNPIIYNGMKWSFDALWEVADHGGIVEDGKLVDSRRYAEAMSPTGYVSSLKEGFNLTISTEHLAYNNDIVDYNINRVDCYILGYGNITLAETGQPNLSFDKENNLITIHVSSETGEEISDAIKHANGFENQEWTGSESWKNDPFTLNQYMTMFYWELYYEISICGGMPSHNYCPVVFEQ